MTTHIHQFLCLKDNYGVLIHDSGSGATAAIDAADADASSPPPPRKAGSSPIFSSPITISITSRAFPASGRAFPNYASRDRPRKRRASFRSIRVSSEGDYVHVGPLAARVIETPGHTAGHIVYWFEQDEIVFTGDTLFSLGCGRVFEAPYSVMWDSLVKLAALPGETEVYCGHEYTEANARFALTIEPDNAVLKSRAAEVAALRAAGQPTLPTTMAAELAANPFLRAELPSVQAALGMAGVDPAAVFAEIRARKDRF